MRYASLDGWRGICALLVAMHHFIINWHGVAHPFILNSYLFVDFFFVLSGFVMSHSWGRKLIDWGNFWRFMALRFARLWPLHVVVLLAFVGLEATKAYMMASAGIAADRPPFTGDTDVTAIFTNLALLHSLGFHATPTWNMPSWSISTEFYTYLIFGLLMVVGLLRSTFWLLLLAFLSAAVILIFSDEYLHVMADLGLFRCIFGFFLGVYIHRFVNEGLPVRALLIPRQRLATVLEIACIALVIGFVMASPKASAISMGAPLVFALAVLVFSAEAGWISKMLTTALPQRLGDWSYSIYMLHSLLLALIGKGVSLVQNKTGMVLTQPFEINGEMRVMLHFGDVWGGDLAMGIYVIALLTASAIAFHLIERPAQDWLGLKLVGRQPKTTPQPKLQPAE